MTRALFICSKNRLRSPTAEAVFGALGGVEVISAGLNADAPTAVSGDLLEWAELIFVMEASHRKRLMKRFGSLLRNKHVIVLGIPDNYGYMDPTLIRLLRRRVCPHLPQVNA